MSTISIKFEVQALDFNPLNRGSLNVLYNNGNQNLTLSLGLVNGVATFGFFQEEPWIDGFSGENEQQAENFRVAFNRDFRNVGGTNNLIATRVADVVTITALTGTWTSALYTGNTIIVSNITISNSPVVTIDSLTVNRTQTGDCSFIEHTAVATGDGALFRLEVSQTTIQSNWDGSPVNFSLQRGKTVDVKLYNQAGFLVVTKNVFVPRRLLEGDFSVLVNDYEDSSDITILRQTVINYTDPLEYSIENNLNATQGTAYQGSNVFTGITQGSYKVFIRDVYGCSVSKIINVSGVTNVINEEQVSYFDIMEGQSFIFKPVVDHNALVKKNYFNTIDQQEYVIGTKYDFWHNVTDVDGFKRIQFKSSYPYHYITYHSCDGNKTDISPIIISQNLGVAEKYDCVIIPFNETQSKVYFNGGNAYEPNTSTVIGSSPYNGTTPSGLTENKLVYLNGMGLRIKSTGYDNNIGGYIVVDFISQQQTLGVIQFTYNKQDYNTFEFIFDCGLVQDKGYITVEKALDGNGQRVGDSWISQGIRKIEDTDEHLLIEWSDVKNKSDIVFQSNIKFFARIKGEIFPVSETESETYSGDSQVYSLSQTARINFTVLIEGISFSQAVQLNIASALSGFKVNGLNLVAKESSTVTRLDKSNLYKWERIFGYGDNKTIIQPDEIVLDVATGVVGGGGIGFSRVVDFEDISLMKDDNENLLTDDQGNLIRID